MEILSVPALSACGGTERVSNVGPSWSAGIQESPDVLATCLANGMISAATSSINTLGVRAPCVPWWVHPVAGFTEWSPISPNGPTFVIDWTIAVFGTDLADKQPQPAKNLSFFATPTVGGRADDASAHGKPPQNA